MPAALGGQGTGRTLPQLTCPTNANRNCTGATTYTGWDNATIWDFGDDENLAGSPFQPPSRLHQRTTALSIPPGTTRPSPHASQVISSLGGGGYVEEHVRGQTIARLKIDTAAQTPGPYLAFQTVIASIPGT